MVFIIVVLLLLMLAINLPPVQNWLTDYATGFIASKTGSKVEIEHIRLRPLGSLLVEEVFAEDLQGDTLLYTGKLQIDFSLSGLFRKQIKIQGLQLERVSGKLYPVSDSTMNYQFLLDAFGGQSPQPDTARSTAGGGLTILMPDANLSLRQIDLYYMAPDSSIEMDLNLGDLNIKSRLVNLQSGLIDLKEVALRNTEMSMVIAEETAPEPADTTGTAVDFDIRADRLLLERTSYELEMPDLQLGAEITHSEATETKLRLTEKDLIIQSPQFDLQESAFYYDVPDAPPARGFDYNHMDLDSINISLRDFNYENLDITGNIQQATAIDKSGIGVTGMKADIHFTLDSIRVSGLQAQTQHSRLRAPMAFITLPFIRGGGTLEDMRIDAHIERAVVLPREIYYFVPFFLDYDAFRRNAGQKVYLNSRISGTLADMRVRQFNLQGWNSRAAVEGRLRHLLSTDSLVVDLAMKNLELDPQSLKSWMPADALPPDIELPTSIQMDGQLKGPLNRLSFVLAGQSSRPAAPVSEVLRIRGQLQNTLYPDSFSLELNIDTLFVSKAALQAYLPADSLPPYIGFPEAMQLQGDLNVTMSDMTAALTLSVTGDTSISRLHVSGNVENFQEIENARFDWRFDSLHLNPHTFAIQLPDSVLPSYYQLPYIEKGKGRLQGQLKNLETQISLQTNFGALEGQGTLKDSTYKASFKMSKVDLRQFFKPGAYDTIVGRALSLFNLRMDIDGHGFHPDEDLQAALDLTFQPTDTSLRWEEGLHLSGQIDRWAFRLNGDVREPGLQADLQASADFNADSAFTTSLLLQLSELDLYELNLTDHPFYVDGRLRGNGEGSSGEHFDADLGLYSVDLVIDSTREHMDSLALDGQFRPGSNRIVIRSDVARGFLRTNFRDPAVIQRIRTYVRSYIDPTVTIDREARDSLNQSLIFSLELTRPGILTSGLVPGLRAMQPSTISGTYSSQRRRFFFNALVPKVDYYGVIADSLNFHSLIGADTFSYQLSFKRMEASEELKAVNVQLTGEAKEDRIVNTLIQTDLEGERRFDIEAALFRREQEVDIQFRPRTLLNYKEWRFSPDNRLVLGRNYLRLTSWQLRRAGQTLFLRDRENKDLIAEFQQFNLRLISNTLNYQSNYIQGILNGRITYENLFSESRLSVEATIDSFGLLEARLGQLQVQASRDAQANLEGRLSFEGSGHDFGIQATYQPRDPTPHAEFHLDARTIDLASLQPLGLGNVEALEGRVTGQLDIEGPLTDPDIGGSLKFISTSFRPTMLQTNWRLDDQSITFDQIQQNGQRVPALRLDQFTILDTSDHPFTINGHISTPDFGTYNLSFNLSADDFLVLNTQKEDNDLYHGQLRIDANGFLGGPLDSAALTLNVTPSADSRIVYTYPVNELQMVESGEGVIEFVSPDTLPAYGFEPQAVSSASDNINPLGWDFTINTSVNENMELKIITNPITGDHFTGQGEGNLAFRMGPKGQIDLSGRIEVISGSYLFTYTELVKRRFDVLPGSFVSWTGDPGDPELSVQAQYTTKATPYPIVAYYKGELSPDQSSTLRRRQQFNVVFQITGSLDDLNINIRIEYPNTPLNTNNSEIASAVNQLNQNESETNTQAFSLLLFNGFLAPGVAGGASGSQVINVQQGLSDMLTNYLNTFADQYISFVEVDFDIESSGETEENVLSGTDVRVTLRKRFLNDRLEIRVDGVATGQERERTDQMQAYLDNITVEYALTKDGVLKIKLYNQRDIDDFLGGEVVKLGGALVFSKDFEKIRLFMNEKKE